MRYSPIDLTAYRIDDILDIVSFEEMLARRTELLRGRWDAVRSRRPDLPAFDALVSEAEPANVILQSGVDWSMLLRTQVNDERRKNSLIGASGAALDHIGITYYNGTTRLVGEQDEAYRFRLSMQPESRSTCGPEGAYTYWAASSHPNILDAATYSEDEGVCLASEVNIYVAAKTGAVTPEMLAAVIAACRAKDRRPKSDKVLAFAAVDVAYAIDVTLKMRRVAGAEPVRAQAEANLNRYASGLIRYLDAGNDDAGPTFVVGRSVNRLSVAGAAWSAAPDQIVEVVVNSPAVDINAPHPQWAVQAAVTFGQQGRTQPLDPALTLHLRQAPRCSGITVRVEQAGGFA